MPVRLVAVLPDDESFDTGASLGIPALTAHRALTAHECGPNRLSLRSLAGFTVLVTGGAGAVGHAAIQLAVWAGATVITTVSGEQKAQLAGAAGAHHVVNYRTTEPILRCVISPQVRCVAEGQWGPVRPGRNPCCRFGSPTALTWRAAKGGFMRADFPVVGFVIVGADDVNPAVDLRRVLHMQWLTASSRYGRWSSEHQESALTRAR